MHISVVFEHVSFTDTHPPDKQDFVSVPNKVLHVLVSVALAVV